MTRWRPLKRFCVRGGEYGLNISSNSYQDYGVRLLRATDIDEVGKLRSGADAVYISAENSDGMLLSSRDILFSRSSTLGRAYVHKNTNEPMTFAGYLVRFRPRVTVDCRYIRYCSQASFFSDQILADAVVSTIANFNAERYGAIAIPWHSKCAQGAIADFLDAETVRIDALIAKKRQMIDLIAHRFWTSIEDMSLRAKVDYVPLRRALGSIVDGPFGSAFSSADYSLSGAAVVRLGNIGFAEYRHDHQAYIPMGLFEKFLRHRVRKGDLLIAGLGDDSNHAGRACVSPDLGDAIVKGKCFSATVPPSRASVRYLAYVLSSPAGVQAVGLSARGSTRSMINLDIIKSTIIPLPSVEVQRSIADLSDIARLRADRIVSALERQIALLLERRQALITAVVTGEMDVPGVSA